MKVEFCELLENLKHLKNADLRKRLSAQTPLAAAKNGARGLSTSQRHSRVYMLSDFSAPRYGITNKRSVITNKLIEFSKSPQFSSISEA